MFPLPTGRIWMINPAPLAFAWGEIERESSKEKRSLVLFIDFFVFRYSKIQQCCCHQLLMSTILLCVYGHTIEYEIKTKVSYEKKLTPKKSQMILIRSDIRCTVRVKTLDLQKDLLTQKILLQVQRYFWILKGCVHMVWYTGKPHKMLQPQRP